MLINAPHDGHEAIVAVLAVDRRRQQILDVSFIVSKGVKKALQAKRADARMATGDFGTDLDLAGDRREALVKFGDYRGIVALGEVG